MQLYRVRRITPYSGVTNKGINCHRQPKEVKEIVNIITGELKEVTDLDRMKKKRRIAITRFFDYYHHFYKNKEVSLFEVVLPIKNGESISKFTKHAKRVLSKTKTPLLGYCWIRDIGEDFAAPHYHIVIAVSRVNMKGAKLPEYLKFGDFWDGACTSTVKSVKKIQNYYLKKGIPNTQNRQRTYGKSMKFLFPKAT